MTELYRNERVAILECANHKAHSPHKWRWGFLKLRKGSCGGLKNDIVFAQSKHKHKLLLHMYPEYLFINPNKVVLHCSGCGDWFSTDKDDYYKVLLSNRRSIARLSKGSNL